MFSFHHAQAMDTDTECQYYRRVPTLVQLCQRAANANAEAIESLGHLSYALAKPILDRCTIEQLLRFEHLSPHLKNDTSEIWRDLCFRTYHLTAVGRYSPTDLPEDPDSWRSRYFALQELEAQRIEEIGSRIRTQRQEADERKKEKEVRYTDRVPPAKRLRTGGWNNVSQPKSLFQKTRSEASKFQRALNTRIPPPVATASNRRILPAPSGSTLPSAVSSSNRVSVNITVPQRQPMPSSFLPTTSSFDLSPAKSTTRSLANIPSTHAVGTPSRESFTASILASPLPESPRSLPSPRAPKKDPMASLFVPKRKPPSVQRPS